MFRLLLALVGAEYLAVFREWWVAAAGPSGDLAMTSSKLILKSGTMQSDWHPSVEPLFRKKRSPNCESARV